MLGAGDQGMAPFSGDFSAKGGFGFSPKGEYLGV